VAEAPAGRILKAAWHASLETGVRVWKFVERLEITLLFAHLAFDFSPFPWGRFMVGVDVTSP
jgi:hypothetical protein